MICKIGILILQDKFVGYQVYTSKFECAGLLTVSLVFKMPISVKKLTETEIE